MSGSCSRLRGRKSGQGCRGKARFWLGAKGSLPQGPDLLSTGAYLAGNLPDPPLGHIVLAAREPLVRRDVELAYVAQHRPEAGGQARAGSILLGMDPRC